MKLSEMARRPFLGLLVFVQVVMTLASCGGTTVAGGVGSGGSGVAEGSVTGFGSVIVEGVAYGDSNAIVSRWGEEGVAEVKLGQRVRVLHDDSGQASGIVVLPQLIGRAGTAPDSQGDFVLLGQRVRIVGIYSTDYPATVFDGLTQVQAGDALEVHGSWSRDDQGRNLLIASRIEKLASSPQTVLLTAMVRSRSGTLVTLDDAAGTPVRVQALPDSVQAGALVSFWLGADVVQTAASTTSPWQANKGALASAMPDNGDTLDLHGAVSDSDSQLRRIRVQGLWVPMPGGWTDTLPGTGSSVQVKLQRSGGDWQTQSLILQPADNQKPDVELKGSLLWNSSADSLQLRGTTVQIDRSLLTGSCAGLRDGEEVYVSLSAQRRRPGLAPQAARMDCSQQIPDASVQQAQGTLLDMDTEHNTLRVRVGSNTLTLAWIVGQTLMPQDRPLQNGMAVEIEYQRSSNGLVLRKIKPE